MEEQSRTLTEAVLALSASAAASVDNDAATALCDHLRPLASRASSREWHHESPSTTELVHGAFERLFLRPRAQGRPVEWENSQAFLLAAAGTIKRLLVEEARKRASLKRGRGYRRIPLTEVSDPLRTPPQVLLELADAIDALSQAHARVAQAIELRFFGGLSTAEIASVLGVTERTVRRDWEAGRLWLYRRLNEGANRERAHES